MRNLCHDHEEMFHDRWAETVDPRAIDVLRANTALTAPDIRFIHERLGDVRNLAILDVGCGFGEVSVYFAQAGANVTAVDISEEMLKATERLATLHNIALRTHKGAIEKLDFPTTEKFDVIFVGNLFHHTDIAQAMDNLLRYLKTDGRLVATEPLAYNPLINLYRVISPSVRTRTESPLTKKDIQIITSSFHRTELRFFWLSTLVIFILMFAIQWKNPNKIRYWKTVVDDSNTWAGLYRPLEKIDELVIRAIPLARWLCRTVVIIGKDPILTNDE